MNLHTIPELRSPNRGDSPQGGGLGGGPRDVSPAPALVNIDGDSSSDDEEPGESGSPGPPPPGPQPTPTSRAPPGPRVPLQGQQKTPRLQAPHQGPPGPRAPPRGHQGDPSQGDPAPPPAPPSQPPGPPLGRPPTRGRPRGGGPPANPGSGVDLPSWEEALGTNIPTMKHVPKSTRAEWSKTLTHTFQGTKSSPDDEVTWQKGYILVRCVLPA